MYFTYSDEKVITRLKFYKYTNQDSSKTLIFVEKLGDIQIGYKYHTADILPNGLSIIFSQNNTIDIFEVQEEAFEPKFHRRLPLFVFKNSTEFWMNEGELDPLYQIADEYLFVIFGQPKYLYVYNLLERAHNSLVTRMKLDPSYNALDTYLIIENVKFTSSFYIFVFYGSEKYEVILFEPNNWMLGDIDNESNLFLNQTEIETAFYPDKIINLTLTPFYANGYPHKEILPLNLSMNCTNKGLKIQSRYRGDLLEIAQRQDNITFSLLDYFDGFNMSYSYDLLQGSENDTSIYISKEDHQSYYLNQDTVGRHAKATFIYNDNDLFVFYSSSTKIDRYDLLDPLNSYKSIENLNIVDN